MSLNFGSNKIKEIYLGSNKINEAYTGSNKVYDCSATVTTFKYKTKQYGNYIWTIENIAETDGGEGIFEIDLSPYNPIFNYNYPNNFYYTLAAAQRIVSRYSNLGWRIPSTTDWANLRNSIGSNPGKKMKTTLGWGNTNGTNESEFNSYATGYIWSDGSLDNTPGQTSWGIGQECQYWCSNGHELYLDKALNSANTRNRSGTSSNHGTLIYSLRLVKDA